MSGTASTAQNDNSMANVFHQASFPPFRPTTVTRLMEATAALQRSLAGKGAPGARKEVPTIDAVPAPHEFLAAQRTFPSVSPPPLGGLLDQSGERRQRLPGSRSAHAPPPHGVGAGTDDARFISASFTNPAGTRAYKLYVPSTYRGQPRPLIVMLHGCTQSPDDFAAGTRMNVMAERHNCVVAYPAQTSAANMQKCWNFGFR
jgi:hypothetical protein